MNPYKKISKLEAKIEQLELENKELMDRQKTIDKLEREYNKKMQLAGEARLSYMKLTAELSDAKAEYQDLIKQLTGKVKSCDSTYKKCVKNINCN